MSQDLRRDPVPAETDAWVQAALDRFEGPLTAYATRLTGDADAARDVVQDTFLRLLAAERAKVDPILPQWLFTVCRHRAVDLRRRGKHMTRLDAATLDDHPARNGAVEQAVERRDETSKVLRAIEALPDVQQEVLRLKFAFGLSYRDISAVTGLSSSHVGVRIHEGMRALRARLTKEPANAGRVGGAR
jgi:RNA polymerase sigma-70 factor (ECF subfamily)